MNATGLFIVVIIVLLAIGTPILIAIVRISRLRKLRVYTDMLSLSVQTSSTKEASIGLGRRAEELQKLEQSIHRANQFVQRISEFAPEKIEKNDTAREILKKLTNFLISDAALMSAAASENFFYELIESTDIQPDVLLDALRSNPDLFFELVGKIAKVGISPTLENIAELKEAVVHLKEIAEQFTSLDFDFQLSDIDLDPSMAEIGSHLHVPWLTIGVSVFREIKLMDSGKTSLDNAIKHTLLDIAGTGGGGSLGAAIGTAIFPGLGTILGGIAGAIVGRKITNAIKFKPLESAYQQYAAEYKKYEDKTEKSVRNLAVRLDNYVSERRKDFEVETGRFPSALENSEIAHVNEKLRGVAEQDLREAKLRIKSIVAEARFELQDRLWHRLIGTKIQEFAEASIEQREKEGQEKIFSIEDSITRLKLDGQSSLEKLHALSRLDIIEGGQLETSLAQTSSQLSGFVALQNQYLQTWLSEAQERRRQISDDIQAFWKTTLEKESQQWKEWEKSVKTMEQKVEDERARLGK